MKKCFAIFLVSTFLFIGIATAQVMVITDFPLGVSTSVEDGFFHAYHGGFQAIAYYAQSHPDATIVVIGTADQYQYTKDNDAKNAALALARAHIVKRLLVEQFCVDSTQIIVQSGEPSGKGAQYRSVYIYTELPVIPKRIVDTTYMEPKIIQNEHHHNYYLDNLGLNIRAGVTSSPYGLIPIVSGAVVYKKALHIEAIFGHTFWDNRRNFRDMSLPVWCRMAGGRVIFYPSNQTTFGVTAGWLRIEEISQDFYGYTRMSEGLVMGMQLHFLNLLNLSGEYFPHKERVAENRLASTKNNSFMVSLSINHYFGGDK